jgi:capsular exopolysaccharide synthesis family protein
MPPSSRDGQPGTELRERIGTLRILEAVQSPNVELIQAGDEPRFPVAPRPKRDAVLGGLFGILLGFGLAVLREQSDRTIRSVEGLEAVSNAPLLGVVPHHRALSAGLAPLDLPPEVLEAFRVVHANLRYARMATDCLVVSSASAGDGKTTCAWHLAVTAASTGAQTLLIEADLRRRSLAKRYSIDATPGLSDVLMNETTLAAAVQRIPVAHRTTDGKDIVLHLDVLTAGATVPDPGNLLDSAALHAMLSEAQERYDMVLIDTPPISHVADAIPTMIRAGGALLIGRVGVTHHRELERLRSRLDQLRVPIVGIIANDDQEPKRYYSDGAE